jgi:hypothetical protein
MFPAYSYILLYLKIYRNLNHFPKKVILPLKTTKGVENEKGAYAISLVDPDPVM